MHARHIPHLPPALAPGLARVLVLAALLCGAPAAHAAWPHDPNIGALPVATGAGEQSQPDVLADGAGGAFIVWSDFQANKVKAQRLNAAGTPLWAAGGIVLCTATGAQDDPRIVPDGAGGAIVVWRDWRSGTTSDLYAQRVSGSGVRLWAATGAPVCTFAEDQGYQTVAADGFGGVVVAWEEERTGATDNLAIYAQRLDGAGVRQWATDGVPVCTAAGDQYEVNLIADGNGGAMITWYDARAGNGDIYAQRVGAAGTAQWTANGIPVCNAPNDQYGAQIAGDMAGGAIVTWTDFRSGAGDIYAQRVNGSGLAQWIGNGVPVCGATGNQASPLIGSDQSGGAIIAWNDYRAGNGDIYAQRLGPGGAPQWLANGLAVSSAANLQSTAYLLADGSGGATIVWQDFRGGVDSDLYARRLSGAGVSGWTTNGVAVTSAAKDQLYCRAASDGAGGAILVWMDRRNGTDPDVYGQRVDRYGRLGNPEPTITSVRDVPNDQGGKVRLTFDASYLDTYPNYDDYEYIVWRSVPPHAAAALALKRGATADPAEALRSNRLLLTTVGSTTYAWEQFEWVDPAGFAAYSRVLATTSDSLPGSSPATLYMVDLYDWNAGAHALSAPDSGYSVDNLAPIAPGQLSATYTAANGTFLSWAANPEADLAGYRIYRGGDPSFEPGPASLIASLANTSYHDATTGGVYKLSAVDIHGNESGFAYLVPSGTTDVPDGSAPATLFFAPVAPNPVRAYAMLRFGLPRGGTVRLAVFDVQGREVSDLSPGTMAAGEHTIAWDRRGATGRPVGNGLYFLRLEFEGRTLTRRMTIVD